MFQACVQMRVTLSSQTVLSNQYMIRSCAGLLISWEDGLVWQAGGLCFLCFDFIFYDFTKRSICHSLRMLHEAISEFEIRRLLPL